jgi:hypothetical protein
VTGRRHAIQSTRCVVQASVASILVVGHDF